MARLGAAAALGLAILAGAAIVLTPASPLRHADGAGPLASRNGPGYEMKAIDAAADPGSSAWTFGLALCLATPGDTALLESVTPTATVGSGFAVEGAGLRAFIRTPGNEGINSVSGWPPPATYVPEQLAPVAGFRVTTPCPTAYQPPYTELLIGLGKTSPDGGGWKGITVTYTYGGRSYVLDINHDLLICGAATVAECAQPGPS